MELGSLVEMFFKNGGPGGVFVLIVVTGAVLVYVALARYIVRGSRSDQLRARRSAEAARAKAQAGEGGEQ